MVGSPLVAGWIANAAFLVLVIAGFRELGPAKAITFVVLWLIGYAAAGHVASGAALMIAYVAMLDIVLVFMVFHGDVRLN